MTLKLGFRRLAFLSFAILLATFVGCGDPKTDLEWKMFGLAYHNYADVHRKGPSGVSDLTESQSQFPNLAKRIESGDVVVRWGVRLFRNGGENDKYVLAYEADAAENGGRVLMGGASLKSLSASEFKALELFPEPTPPAQSEISVEEVSVEEAP